MAGDINLDDVDIVQARFEQARAIVDLMQLATTHPDNDVGFGILEEACSALNTLLVQGREAFQRIDAERMRASPQSKK